jgi:transcription-repair coupling factor (superfamily II helicase)
VKEHLAKSQEIQEILRLIKSKEKNIFADGVADCFKGILYAQLISETDKDVFILTSSEKIYSLYAEIAGLKDIFGIKAEILFYPEDDSIMYGTLQSSKEASKARVKVYEEIFKKERKVIITDINALAEKIPGPEKVKKLFFKFKKEDVLNIDKLAEVLTSNKYERVLKVENVFEYSVRGSIIDIYTPDHEYPVRIELFGDRIESLRFFSLDTYSTTKHLENIELLLFNPGNKFKDENGSIIDYFAPYKSMVILDDADTIKSEILEKIKKIEKYIESQDIRDNLFTISAIFRKLSLYQKLKTYSISKTGKCVKFKIRSNPPFNRDIKLFFKYLGDLEKGGYYNYIISDNDGETKHLKELFEEYDRENKINFFKNTEFISANSYAGCVLPGIKLSFISNREIFARYKGKVAGRRKEKFLKPIKHYMELKEKDYVVHREHGIGVFEGVKNMAIDDINSDFIYLRYAGDDKLYLPIYKISMIDKYVGSEGSPVLSKLGGTAWRRTKEEIQTQLKMMAEELLNIYAKRETAGGYRFPQDDTEQKAFEEAFIYEETEDQERAIAEVKADMFKEKPMDRLVCGDAGFGKTEVAMRAAFKAVNAGRQVLVMTATTLLAQQHYFTFKERMADYPVRIEMLSRLVSAKDKKATIEAAKSGRVDIMIGTSSVLGGSVEFLDLGLIIIDEEQHFGVKNKELLRDKYPKADILTLTATPIPRTLYFAMSGIRSISNINTPPPGKRAIETVIAEERISSIKEIILREVLRKGQVFYIHNNIQTIFKLKDTMEKALPEIRFKVAHGRMKKEQLEKIMRDLLQHKFDVLISTTIVESGLDLPDVNTIIIGSADRFGLSQLYQLRGRVGRRDKQAYAYLLVKDVKYLSGIAKERLKTIESYVDPGAGLMIAMKDMELRGSGNILGTKQHGNMEKIGFELYCKMLEEAVVRINSGNFEAEIDTRIKVDFKAFIPDNYIWDSGEKLRVYRRLFAAKSNEDIIEIEKYLKDAWGVLPDEVKNILFVAELKVIGRKLKLYEIASTGSRLAMTWDAAIPQDIMRKLATKYKKIYKPLPNRIEFDFTSRKEIAEMAAEAMTENK